MSTLEVAATQFALEREESVEQFLAHVDRLTARAAAVGAELVVLPELASTGPLAAIDGPITRETLREAYWSHLASTTLRILDGLSVIARERQVTMLGVSHVREVNDGELRNTAFLVHADGRTEFQDKIHLTPPEIELGLSPGDDLLIIEVGGLTVGVLICADIQFPELSRILLNRGVKPHPLPVADVEESRRLPSAHWFARPSDRKPTLRGDVTAHRQQWSTRGRDSVQERAGDRHRAGRQELRPERRSRCQRQRHRGGLVEYTLDLSALQRSRNEPKPPGLSLRQPQIVNALVAKYS